VAGQRTKVTVTLTGAAPASGQIVALEVDDTTTLAAPSSTFVAAGETAAAFWVEALRPARPTRLRARAGGASAEVQIGISGLALAELFYSASGGDDGKQWVRLGNTASVAIDLSRYRLGAGTSNYVTTTAALAGVLAPGACAVVGGPTSSDDNGRPTYT